MDPAAAAHLVAGDSESSRQLNYVNDLVQATETRQVDDYLDTHRTLAKGKGKEPQQRATTHSEARRTFGHDEEEEASSDVDEDGMSWEPPNRFAARTRDEYPLMTKHANQSFLQEEDSDHYRRPPPPSSSTTRARSRRTSSISSVDSRTRRILWWRRAAVNIFFILAWYFFSTLLSVYNKWMLAPDHFDFPYPVFVTSVHMLVQWSLASLTLAFFPHLRPKSRPRSHDYLSKVVPCGMATGLDIGLSNLSLRSITLSFYTMCKSSSLAFVLLFAFAFKLETPSWRLAGIILIITSGVVLMVSTETQFDFAGMVEVLTASALGGLRWSLTQILLDKEAMGMGNPIATLFWLAPVMGLTLAIFSALWDGWFTVFSNERFFGSFSATMYTLAAILFPGCLAFLMNITEFGLIQRTSVVTLSVAGIFKEVAVILLSMAIFHDLLTPINISGLVVTIFGIALYNYLKYDQFTSGEGGGHGGGKRKDTATPAGFSAVPEDSYAEDEDMPSSPRARHAANILGTTSASASILHGSNSDYSSAAPLHSLGDLSPSSSRSASLDEGRHHLRRASSGAKADQSSEGAVPGLAQALKNDPQLAELERRERQVEQNLQAGVEQHREAEDWDLLVALEDDDGTAHRGKGDKKLL